MSYYFSTTLHNIPFDDAIALVTAELQNRGFGVLSDIDVQATLKKKIDVDFKRYRILGACNPRFAHRALSSEEHIGVFLPCNVVVTEHDDHSIEVIAVDPIASMMAVQNQSLESVASEVQAMLRSLIDSLKG